MINMKNTILVVGAGHQGLAMAAHFSLCGEKVYLWNRTESHIEEVIKTKSIECDGVVSGTAHIEMASSNIEELLTNTVFVAAPSSAHRDIAALLADKLLPNTIIFLNPGRTFGAIDFLVTLEKNGCKNKPIIVETQSIVYTCRRMGSNRVNIYALKKKVDMAYLGNSDSETIKSKMPECIRDRFVFANNVLQTSLGNVGMILHCAPILLNTGWIESDKHAFYYYYDGISPSVGQLLEKLDCERVNVAKALKINTYSLIDWFDKTYSVKGNSIFECIQKNDYYKEIDAPKSLKHRYLEEDVPNGLVPLEYLGKSIGVDVANTTLVIDLAQTMCNVDYRKTGRKYTIEDLRKYVAL